MNKLLLVLIFICQCSFADSIYLGAWSQHSTSSGRTLNEENNLIGYEQNGYLVGVFKNSYSNWSTIVAKQYKFTASEDFKFNVNVGIVHGYTSCYGNRGKEKTTCLALVPELSYVKYKIQPTVVLLGQAVALTFKLEF